MFENLKIIIVGLLIVLGFYLSFEIAIDWKGVPEVKADTNTATTSLEVGNAAPSASNVLLNGGANIVLIEDSATTVVATCTVTDTNTYSDIAEVYGRLYRSGVTSTEDCTTDPNNCTATTTCATSSCSGSDCVATCSFQLWFVAEPTDVGSTWAAEHWVAWIQITDQQASSSNATNSAQTIEMGTLNALDVTDSIDYGSLSPGEKNDPLDKLVLATTTGNNAIDANISGYDMCTDYPTCVAATTSIEHQRYATSQLAYASTSDGVVIASIGAQLLEFTTVKPTATPSDQGQSIYWGTYASNTALGTYTGVNTFVSASDL